MAHIVTGICVEISCIDYSFSQILFFLFFPERRIPSQYYKQDAKGPDPSHPQRGEGGRGHLYLHGHQRGRQHVGG